MASFYSAADDWAIDITDASFRSVPSFRFGPPGRLWRRDPAVAPLITREAARLALDRLDRSALGIWSVSLRELVESPWPDDHVLVPALGSSRATYVEQMEALRRLRNTVELS